MLTRAARGTPMAAPMPQITGGEEGDQQHQPTPVEPKPAAAPHGRVQRPGQDEPGAQDRGCDGLRDAGAMRYDEDLAPRN